MKHSKTLLLFAIILIAKSTVYCQPSIPDSLKTIEVVRWRIERMIHDVYKFHALQDYVTVLEQEKVISDKLITAQDSTIKIKQKIIDAHTVSSTLADARYTNQVDLTKQEKRGKRRWRLVAIGVSVLVVISTIK